MFHDTKYSEQPENLLKGLLALVNDSGGAVEGRVRIQKSAFLLKNLGVPEFGSAKFSYHYYGPYSRDLSSELHNAVISGLLKESVHQLPNEPLTYSYTLTKKGKDWLEKFDENRQQDRLFLRVDKKKLDILKEKEPKTLELAATAIYLQKKYPKLVNFDQALKKALELKPRCISAQKDAHQTLEALGLAIP